MNKKLSQLLVLVFVTGPMSVYTQSRFNKEETVFTIAFGSCNKTTLNNELWDDILDSGPDLWIWGGDNIYADTGNMQKLKAMYKKESLVLGYKKLKSKVPVIGTWDDHDYGVNNGGADNPAKKGSEQAFWDFMGVPKASPLRKQEGVYSSNTYPLPNGSVKVILLDSRYFRTALTSSKVKGDRFQPNVYGEGTILGEKQWEWLGNELKNSRADFNIIMSSIQFLSDLHGFECWGNFPHERDRLERLIVASRAKGVVILSGDRHISELSRTDLKGLSYPLVDFTSSGLTHVYSKFSGEPNPYRVGEVIKEKSFGLLKIQRTSVSNEGEPWEGFPDFGTILLKIVV